MEGWQTASLTFFLYIAAIALSMRGLSGRQRALAIAGSAAGLGVSAAAVAAPRPILNDWIVPPALLLLGYWTSGLLFVAPMPRVERVLQAIDERLRIRAAAGAAPRIVAELLEFAYAAVYPVIPLALVIHVSTADDPDPSRFWTVILVTDYLCFGMLPWIQTRTPRSLEDGQPWRAALRAMNLRLLGRTSIHVNTFPSGHAAEALAAALLVSTAPAPVFAAMLLVALAIAAGAALGRYHYAADVFAGWIVASLVWSAFYSSVLSGRG